MECYNSRELTQKFMQNWNPCMVFHNLLFYNLFEDSSSSYLHTKKAPAPIILLPNPSYHLLITIVLYTSEIRFLSCYTWWGTWSVYLWVPGSVIHVAPKWHDFCNAVQCSVVDVPMIAWYPRSSSLPGHLGWVPVLVTVVLLQQALGYRHLFTMLTPNDKILNQRVFPVLIFWWTSIVFFFFHNGCVI